MEKMMLAIGRLKEGEGKFEKFMAFFQSEEGMAMRKAAAHVEKQFLEFYLIKAVSCLKFMFIMKRK